MSYRQREGITGGSEFIFFFLYYRKQVRFFSPFATRLSVWHWFLRDRHDDLRDYVPVSRDIECFGKIHAPLSGYVMPHSDPETPDDPVCSPNFALNPGIFGIFPGFSGFSDNALKEKNCQTGAVLWAYLLRVVP